MASSVTANTTAGSALTTLLSEAQALQAQARRLKEEMERLNPTDPQRAVFEKNILELLERARNMSFVVTTSTSSYTAR